MWSKSDRVFDRVFLRSVKPPMIWKGQLRFETPYDFNIHISCCNKAKSWIWALFGFLVVFGLKVHIPNLANQVQTFVWVRCWIEFHVELFRHFRSLCFSNVEVQRWVSNQEWKSFQRNYWKRNKSEDFATWNGFSFIIMHFDRKLKFKMCFTWDCITFLLLQEHDI